MIVRPLYERSLRSCITDVAVKESSPVVGSSKNIKFGSVTSSIPIEVRFRSPPDTPLNKVPPIFVLWHLVNPNSSMILSTVYYFSSCVPFNFRLAANSIDSLTVKVWKRKSSCYTKAQREDIPLVN